MPCHVNKPVNRKNDAEFIYFASVPIDKVSVWRLTRLRDDEEYTVRLRREKVKWRDWSRRVCITQATIWMFLFVCVCAFPRCRWGDYWSWLPSLCTCICTDSTKLSAKREEMIYLALRYTICTYICTASWNDGNTGTAETVEQHRPCLPSLLNLWLVCFIDAALLGGLPISFFSFYYISSSILPLTSAFIRLSTHISCH